MSDREQMIEKAAKAVLDNFNPPDERHSSWWLNPETVARAVFAVFEEAHAPTDAERGSWRQVQYEDGGWSREMEWVPEPQAEPSDAQVQDALNAYYGVSGAWISEKDNWVNQFAPNMRAALRAAASVTEQGENR